MIREPKFFGAMLLLAVLGGCRQSPEFVRDRNLASGKRYLEKRDYSRAILAFKNAVQAMPKDAEPYYEIGVASEESGDLRTAVGAYKEALQLNPNYAPAKLRIAELKAQTDDQSLVKDARSEIQELLKSSAATPEMLNTLAFTELKLGDTASAVQSLERALSQSPGELTSSLMLARAKLVQKDVKGAEGVLKKACDDRPKSAEARRLLGDFYVEQMRTPEAEAQFRKALEIDPKSGPALMDLGRLELALGRKQEAEQTFKHLAAFDGYKPVYGLFLSEQGRRDEAVREFEKLASENPDDRQIRTDLILAYRSQNRMVDVTRVLDAALKKNPKDSDALLERGELSFEAGKYSEAETDLNKVRSLRPNAPQVHYILAKLDQKRGEMLTYRQELSETIRLNPALLSVRLELAQDYLANKNAQAAFDLLNATPEVQKLSVPVIVERNWALWALGDMSEMRKGIDRGLQQQKSADLWIQDGLWKLRSNDPEAARAALEQALKIDPSDLRALTALSQTYVSEKKVSLGLQKVKEYAASHPKSAPVQEFLGLMLFAQGLRTEARAAFAASKQADPNFAQADMSLIQLDFADNRLTDARTKLETVLSKNTSNVTARLWLGNLNEMTGNHTEAVAQFRKVVEANPSDAQAENNLAYLMSEYGNKPDEALTHAQRAIELAPEKPAYCDTLGWILYRKGLYGPAVNYLEKANSDKRATNATWMYHLAMAYAKAGNRTRGQSTFDAALKLNPKLPEAKLAQEVVEASH